MTLLDDTIKNYNPETFVAEPILKYFEERYPNISSRQVKLSQFKKELMLKTDVEGFKNGYEYNVSMRKLKKQSVLLPQEIRNLRLDVELQQKIKEKQLDSLTTKVNNNLILKDSEKFFKEILDGLKSKTFDKLLPALLLVSGRRTTEILKTASFGKTKKGWIEFNGKLKSANKDGYTIPLLVRSSTFKKALKQLRVLVPEIVEDNLSNADVQNTFKTRINNAFNKINNRYNISITPHNMRSLYVAFAEKKFKKKEQTYFAFANQILCHDGLAGSLHYLSVVLE